MSTFTISIKELVEQDFDFGLTADDYPILREELRGVKNPETGRWGFTQAVDDRGIPHLFGLNRKILDHYWHREIGFESEDMFRWYLNAKLRERMPYYNQLLYSETLAFDPFQTSDTRHVTESTETVADTKHENQNTTGSTDSDTQGRNVSSQFPQMMLAGNGDYASSGVDTNAQTHGASTSEATGESTRNVNTGGNVSMHITGSQGHSAALLMQYRRSFLNIELMIINDLESLFMGVLDNNDSKMNEGNDNHGPFGLGYPYFFPTF